MTEYDRVQTDNNGAIWQLMALFTLAVPCTREIVSPINRTITGHMISRIGIFVVFYLHLSLYVLYSISPDEDQQYVG